MTLYCSFCAKSQDDVEMMVSDLSVNICSECIEVCAEMLADYRESADQEGQPCL